jgi:hypothetical protein
MATQSDELIDLCLEVGTALDLRRRDDGPVIDVEWKKFDDGLGGQSPAQPPTHDLNSRDWPVLISDSFLLNVQHGHDVRYRLLDVYIHECTHAILQTISPSHSGHGFAFSTLDFALRLRADGLSRETERGWWPNWNMQWSAPSLYDIQELRGHGEVYQPCGIAPGDTQEWRRFGQRIGLALQAGSQLAASEMSPRQMAVEAILKWQQLIKPKAAPQPVMAPSLPRAVWNWLWYGSTLGPEAG